MMGFFWTQVLEETDVKRGVRGVSVHAWMSSRFRRAVGNPWSPTLQYQEDERKKSIEDYVFKLFAVE